jgi:aerobic carbon-monoxide dehydrogenase medium subunit
MYASPFRYSRANSIKEAEELFAAGGDARYLSGGMTLIPTMKLRLAAPENVIDLNSIPDLAFVRRNGDVIEVGGRTRHADVAASDETKRTIPALAYLASIIGDPSVRHRGTLGGSIANNDPAADYPAAIVALQAKVITSRREIAGDEFFTGMFATALEEGEIVTAAAFQIPKRAGYAKFPNPASRYAVVGVFVADFNGTVRVAVTGAGPCVFPHSGLEAALTDRFTPAAAKAVKISAEGLNSDLHASAEYRAHLINIMAARAVEAALD